MSNKYFESDEQIEVKIKINKEMKEKAEATMKQLGLDFKTAVTVFVYQVYYTQSIPFIIQLPNKNL